MSTRINPIHNRADFDAATSKSTTPTADQPDGAPTVFLITHSPGPATKAFLPQYEELVEDDKWKHVLFYRMEESPETAPLIKFGPQARPIVMLIRKEWSRTLACPTFKEFAKLLEESFGKST